MYTVQKEYNGIWEEVANGFKTEEDAEMFIINRLLGDAKASVCYEPNA